MLGRVRARLQTLSEEDLRRAFESRSSNVLFRVLLLVSGTLLLIVRGIVLLVANWKLILLELVPAVWLGVVLWDLRRHTIEGDALVVPSGWAAAGAAAVIAVATTTSYWCNVAFAFAAVGDDGQVGSALRAAGGNRRPILLAALAVSAGHAWVSLRGATIGVGTFSVGIAVVVAVNMYLYTALPARVVGIGRSRASIRERVERSVVAGTISAVAAAPGFLLSRLGQVLLAISVTRPVGMVVLVVAVLLQVAGISSSRAVAMSSELLRAREQQP
jgi:hypothetical protein